ncbi:hypothetical protein CFIO01_07077 [Colletotrichum fioriniae PJ7]|uniref:Uncharacterized protein n=1 Tax=Colletotrichum fioriniae PJ7 TaxID=1445577 RepID=A0A010R5H9_9PEZI|nr:hypothetical protein CFIO01_07077 [Colletotrichum fioriniae PJ7]
MSTSASKRRLTPSRACPHHFSKFSTSQLLRSKYSVILPCPTQTIRPPDRERLLVRIISHLHAVRPPFYPGPTKCNGARDLSKTWIDTESETWRPRDAGPNRNFHLQACTTRVMMLKSPALGTCSYVTSNMHRESFFRPRDSDDLLSVSLRLASAAYVKHHGRG